MNRTPTLPELDLVRIQRFCDGRSPEQVRHLVRVEMEVRGRAVTIVERRAPWTPAIGPEWTRSTVARLRHVAKYDHWVLDWADRNARWHRYDLFRPAKTVAPLLAEIERDPASIFWG